MTIHRDHTAADHGCPRRVARGLAALAALAGVAVLVAGCGGSNPGVAQVSNSTSTSSTGRSGSGSPPTRNQIEHEALAFAQCMRSHGVSTFSDPTAHGLKISITPGHATSPALQSAETACRHLLPSGPPPSESTAPSQAQIDALLAFARCLRSHGFPSFPDPTGSGQLTHEMLARAGIDVHEPAVIDAADVCTRVTHGVITKAVVARFAAGH
jgi:hypothetical protein